MNILLILLVLVAYLLTTSNAMLALSSDRIILPGKGSSAQFHRADEPVFFLWALTCVYAFSFLLLLIIFDTVVRSLSWEIEPAIQLIIAILSHLLILITFYRIIYRFVDKEKVWRIISWQCSADKFGVLIILSLYTIVFIATAVISLRMIF